MKDKKVLDDARMDLISKNAEIINSYIADLCGSDFDISAGVLVYSLIMFYSNHIFKDKKCTWEKLNDLEYALKFGLDDLKTILNQKEESYGKEN